MKKELEYEKVRELGELLEELRRKKGKTQTEVAKETGFSQQFISTTERLNPHAGVRFFDMLEYLRYYDLEPNEAARILGLLDGK